MLFPNIREKLDHWTNVNTEEEFVSHVLGKKVTSIHSADVSKVRDIIQTALHANSRSLNQTDLPSLQNLRALVCCLPGRADWSTWWKPARLGKLVEAMDKLIQSVQSIQNLQQPVKLTPIQSLEGKLITQLGPDPTLNVLSFLSYNRQLTMRAPNEVPDPHFTDADFLPNLADAVKKMDKEEVEELCQRAADRYIPSGKFDLNDVTTATNIKRLGTLLKEFFLNASLEQQGWFFQKALELRGFTLRPDKELAEAECFLVNILYSLPSEMTRLHLQESEGPNQIVNLSLLSEHIIPILHRLSKLEDLVVLLCSQQVTSSALKEVKHHMLKDLRLVNSHLSDEIFSEFFNQPEREYLEKLDIVSWSLFNRNGIDWQALKKSALNSLRRLNIGIYGSDPRIHGIGGAGGPWNASMQLRYLGLHNNFLSDSHFIPIIRQNSLLEELTLDGSSGLTDMSLAEITNILSSLKLLNLLNTNFSQGAIVDLLINQNMKQLEKFYLSGANDEILRLISNNFGSIKLLMIDNSKNDDRMLENVTNVGVQAIVSSQNMQHLQVLSFRNCNDLTEYSVTLLAKSPFMKELRILRLPFSDLSDETIEDILNSEYLNLQEIWLRSSYLNINDERFNTIAQRLQAAGIRLQGWNLLSPPLRILT